MSGIFISYRQAESAATCGRIYDRLIAHFGIDAVFNDVDSIGYGTDFRVAIQQALDRCAVQLVIIGPQWLTVTSAQGQPRLFTPQDIVRFEVESALQRGMTTIPVLVQGAAPPPEANLPKSLAQLTYLNAVHVRYDPDFEEDMRRLIGAIERVLPPHTPIPPASSSPAAVPAANVPQQPTPSSQSIQHQTDPSPVTHTTEPSVPQVSRQPVPHASPGRVAVRPRRSVIIPAVAVLLVIASLGVLFLGHQAGLFFAGVGASSSTWKASSSTTGSDLFSIAMVSSNEGWAVGRGGTILHYLGGDGIR